VAYDADPNSGVYVIFNNSTYVFGGTSIAAPQWAGLVALADQGRGASTAPANALDGANQLLPALYSMTSTALSKDFHDVKTGSTRSGRTTYTAGAGYDLVTGLGTPVANSLVPDLVGVPVMTSSATSGGTGDGGGHSGPHLATNESVNNNSGNNDPSSDGNDDSRLNTQLVSPSAIILEVVAPAPVAVASEPGISVPLADILFAGGDLDTQMGLHSTTSQAPILSAVLGPLAGQRSDTIAISVGSRWNKEAFPASWAKLTEEGVLGEDDPSTTEDQLVDLALVADGDCMV
jgi:hypothetical protein